MKYPSSKMESDLQPHYHFLHDQPQQQHQKPMNSGLARYQSAPSTYFSSFLDRELSEDFLSTPTSPETERILSRFLSNSGGSTDNLPNQNLGAMKQESPASEAEMQEQANNQAQMMASINNNSDIAARFNQQQQTDYSSAPQSFYHSQSKPPLIPDHGSSSGMDYRAGSSMGLQRLPLMRTGGGSNSNLVRHSSSPAGLFSNINIEFENGFAVVKGMGDFGASNREASYPAASRPASSSGRMSPIAEMGDRNMNEENPDDAGYLQDFSIGSWDDTAVFPSGTKGLISDDRTLSGGLTASETQNVEAGKPPRMLAHHLSLPSSSIEKLLQIQDSVPCKIRAKRGCATHPRSIAERVRRTRISERMRKLQDLVPNMDKQTNTADMLDLAVDYIKDLQRQLKGLQDDRSKCACGNKHPS